MPAKRVPATKAELAAENKRLSAELKRLQQQNTQSSPRRSVWRTLLMILLTVLSGIVLVFGNLLFWAGHTLIDNDRYEATVAPIIENEEVQKGIALYATDRIFESVDVEAAIEEALPPRAVFLAPPLAERLRDKTQDTFEELLATERFQTIWRETTVNAHDRLIERIKSGEGDGVVSLQEVYQRLTAELQDTKLAFLANTTLPDRVGSIVLIEADWLPKAHNIVTNIGLYEAIATIVFLASAIGAILLAPDRRRAVVRLGLFFGILMFLTLVGVRITNHLIADSAAPQYRTAVSEAVDIISGPLILATRTVLLVGLLGAFIAWLSGPYGRAAAMRGRIQLLLEGRAHRALFKRENSFTVWVGANKHLLQWTAVAVVGVIMLFVSLSPALVFWYALLIAALIVLIELFAADAS